ncbi:hypothetical protein ACSVBT_04890 [Afipia sp. TerB]
MKPSGVLTSSFIFMRNLLAGGFLNSAGIGFAAYIIVICLPGIRATAARLDELREGVISMSDVGESSLHIAVPALLLGLLLFARHGVFRAIYRTQAFLVFLLVFSSLVLFTSLVGSDYLVSGTQMLQYVVTVGCFVLCLCFWQAPGPAIDNALAMAFLALAGSLTAAAVIQGFHDYRWVGLIHPNHYARYAYIALVLHSMLTRRVSLLVFIPCFAAAYMVSARTVMIGIILFYMGYLACTNFDLLTSRMRQFASVRTLAISMVALPIAVMVASFFIDGDRLLDKIEKNLAIFDPNRGVSSGFTGRAESWNAFFDTMDQFAFIGYGFRSSRYGLNIVHSGILSYFIDFGLILGSILLVAIAARAAVLIWVGVSRREHRGLIAGLTIATTLLIQFFEPDNFNIGFIGAFFFMLILAYTEPVRMRRGARRVRAAPVAPAVTPQLSAES